MMSHHAFRRDVARFHVALDQVRRGDTSRTGALREEWESFRATLHGHHEAEDTRMFPHMKSEHASLVHTIEQLTADHERIHSLLERGDRAFSELPATDAASKLMQELEQLLVAHLAREEASVIPLLREVTAFPPPGSDEEAEIYAQGFAWSSQGIAPHVLDRVYSTLPESVTSKLPSARASFDARCERVWGSAKAGASTTSVPDPETQY